VTSAPPAVRGRPTATLLGRFAIPLRYGGSSVKAEGVVSYVPPAGGVVTSLTSPMQPALGLTVALLPGRFPDVYLQNSGTTTVTVLGEGGEPFAQIGPQGVRVNLRSPIHDADLTARGQTPRVRTDLSAAPLWQDVSATPSYDWFDPRPHFLPSWTIPLHLGARTIPVQGVQRFAAPTTVSSLLASRHAPPEGRQFRHVGDPGDLSARRRRTRRCRWCERPAPTPASSASDGRFVICITLRKRGLRSRPRQDGDRARTREQLGGSLCMGSARIRCRDRSLLAGRELMRSP